MQNVTTEVKGSILTITVDLSKSFGPSKSGKSTIVAGTGGFVKVGPVSLNVNVISGSK